MSLVSEAALVAGKDLRIEARAKVIGQQIVPFGLIVLLRIDPQRTLFPTIQAWPVSSASGELLLVERRGDRIVYLNALRHRQGTGLRLQRALDDETLPATHAVRGAARASEPGARSRRRTSAGVKPRGSARASWSRSQASRSAWRRAAARRGWAPRP